MTGASLLPVARLLNITVTGLAERTIASAYPWATGLLAREACLASFGPSAPLRPAVCPQCLGQQRAVRGFSWLRREWVLAWRTMCPRHAVRLIEGGETIVPPAWQEFFRRHRRVQQATCPGPLDSIPSPRPAPPQGTSMFDPLENELLQVQNALVAKAARGKAGTFDGRTKVAIMVGDILWALTRPDRAFPERLAYEAFALQKFDSEWHIARRRLTVPTDYTRFGVHVRHAMMAAAAVVAGGKTIAPKLCLPRTSSGSELGFLLAILTKSDADGLVARSCQWPERSRTALRASVPASRPATPTSPAVRSHESTIYGISASSSAESTLEGN